MSKHPHVQQEIKRELRNNEIISTTDLALDLPDKLIYVDYVMKEVLRMAPIIDCTIRTLLKDDEFNGVKVRKDKNHNPYTLGIFGSGHRACAGQDLARLELKTIVTQLMQYVTFVDRGEEKNSDGKLQGLMTAPKHIGVYIRFD
ncbi:unnamed protein product [Didymodactylos carnosus]|uniref:Cytochrome P450 n=1 Tax=Didymodactylos carnosus TaxID=1234261 RepID=A0A815WZN0_9BILA|nr:unnamed protein product [Didymodactylos carnosus]CAF4413108.1 unnamed protein product [Didymodactylos carnosus]